MNRIIVKEDVVKIQALLADVMGYHNGIKIDRMGGLTNHSYKVQLDNGTIYAVRIPGEGTEELINRADEQISTKLACSLDIDAKLLYFGKDGSKITEYIPHAVTMSKDSMCKQENLERAAKILRKLHSCGQDTQVPFKVFDMAASYEQIVNKFHVGLFDDYETTKKAISEVKDEIDHSCKKVEVPCHNDPLCENWVTGEGKLYLIDWEYAGMNDGMWDVAAVALEAEYTPALEESFLMSYLDCDKLTPIDWKRFIANKIYVDFLWTLWAKARVHFDGQPMEDWASQRYARLLTNLRLYQRL